MADIAKAKQVATAVREALERGPGNPELDQRWDWGKATLLKDGDVSIPAGTSGQAKLLVSEDLATIRKKCIGVACFTQAPKAIHVAHPNAYQIDRDSNAEFEGRVLHEIAHEGGASEFGAYSREQSYLAPLGYPASSPHEILIFVATRYSAMALGKSLREFCAGKPDNITVEQWFPPNGESLKLAMVEKRINAEFGAFLSDKQLTREHILTMEPGSSLFVWLFRSGLLDGGPLDLSELKPENRKKVEALLKAPLPQLTAPTTNRPK